MLPLMIEVSLRLDAAIAVAEYRCHATRGATSFIDWHARSSLSHVRKGSFDCHSRGQSFELVAGSGLMRQRGDGYMCTHDPVRGSDACLSIQRGAGLEDSLENTPGIRTA
jgi:hypothetical protein